MQGTRGDILELVQSQGGLHKSELCRATGLGWGTICHHVQALEREQRIDIERHGRQTWAFSSKIDPEIRPLFVALTNGERRDLLSDLAHRSEVTITGLCDELTMSRKVVRTHLTHLVDAGAVERHGSRPHRYRVKPAALALAKRLFRTPAGGRRP